MGILKPNGYGLDITGNAWEWCQDWYDSDKGGGYWGSNTINLRVARRTNYPPDSRGSSLGFRCVADVE